MNIEREQDIKNDQITNALADKIVTLINTELPNDPDGRLKEQSVMLALCRLFGTLYMKNLFAGFTR